MSALISRGAVLAAVLVAISLAVLPAPVHAQCAEWKPVVDWNTYLGGGLLPNGELSPDHNTDRLEGVAVNEQGEVFVTGQTDSSDFPASNTGLPAAGSGMDAVVAKFSADGKTRLWARVFGGSKDDSGLRVALGKSGDVYVVGTSASADLLAASGSTARIVWPHQGSAGGNDAFLARLTPAGELRWLMFLGGGEQDEGLGLSIDPDGMVYVSGRTQSSMTNLPGPWAGARGDGYDVFVLKVDVVTDPENPKHLWTRFIGTASDVGTANDAAYAVVARKNEVYVGGSVGSIVDDSGITNIIVPFHRGADDGFVAKLNPADGTVVWMTHMGSGNGTTEVRDILVRSDGGLVTVGSTTSTDFISSGSGSDVFLFRLDSDGNALTELDAKRRLVLSGTDDVDGHAAIDPQDNIYIGGRTSAGGFTTRGFDTTLEGSTEGFVLMLDPNLRTRWGSYVGGTETSSDGEWVRGVAVNSKGQLAISGYSNAWPGALPKTGSYQLSSKGGDEGVLLRVTVDFTEPVRGSVSASATPHGRITATWTGFEDAESSIARYEWSITALEGGAGVDFQPVTGTAATARDFLPEVGKHYHVTVRATNGAGCGTVSDPSNEVVLTTPPDPTPDPEPEPDPDPVPTPGGEQPGGGDGVFRSPVGWGCGSTGGGAVAGALAVTALALWTRRQRTRGSAD